MHEFDIDPRQLEEFGQDAFMAICTHLEPCEHFIIVTAPDARPYVRRVIERLSPTLQVSTMSRSLKALNCALCSVS